MSTHTTRLNLTKAASSENVDVTAHINNNLDLIDAGIGTTISTSAAKPASAFSGRTWYETDTGVFKVNSASSASTSASWVSAASINGGFTNSYDTSLWIAPVARNNPTNNSQGLYIQHRVSGNLGSLVHDAAASELRLSTAASAGAGQNAHEASLVVTAGANTITKLNGSLANFHTEGTPSGTVDEVALFRATAVPALTGTIAVSKVYGIYLDDQTVGASANYSLYALGPSYAARFIPKDSTSQALVGRALSTTIAGTDLLRVENSSATGLFRVNSSGQGGFGAPISNSLLWVNAGVVGGSQVGLRVRANSAQTADLAEYSESGGAIHLRITAATASLRANLVVGGSAVLATGATSGFLYPSTMAGTPSGTPTAFTGTAPIVLDTSGNKLWAYLGGAWKSVTLA